MFHKGCSNVLDDNNVNVVETNPVSSHSETAGGVLDKGVSINSSVENNSENCFQDQSLLIDQDIADLEEIGLPFDLDCFFDPKAIVPNIENEGEADWVLPQYDIEEDSPLTLWGPSLDFSNIKIEDIFQADETDLFQGPTLAELNSNDESLFSMLDGFDFSPIEPKKDKTSSSVTHSLGLHIDSNNADISSPNKSATTSSVKCTTECDSNYSSLKNVFLSSNESSTLTFMPLVKEEKCNSAVICIEILQKETEMIHVKPKTLTYVPDNSNSSQMDHCLENGKHQEDSEIIPDSNCCPTSEKLLRMPKTDNRSFDFHEESTDDDETSSSSEDSDENEEMEVPTQKKPSKKRKKGGQHKSPCYFWQYNTQAKGPKGPPYKQPKSMYEPSTSGSLSIPKDVAKSRRCDSNDLTPCPQKLHHIGVELDNLNSIISNMTPVNALPLNARSKCRKEKNKLASRVCRLKKKAQYEANKLKLFGLGQEYDSLSKLVKKVRDLIRQKIDNCTLEISCEKQVDKICSEEVVPSVMNSPAEFVNNVLRNVESGDPTGGLETWFHNPLGEKGD